jgi:hypothetical protein
MAGAKKKIKHFFAWRIVVQVNRIHADAIAIPNAERKTTAMIEHPAHLLQRDRFIWKEL